MKFNEIKPADLAENEVFVRFFGDFEVENKWGRVSDKTARPQALTWLALKYILMNSNRDVEVEEIMSLSYDGKQVSVPEGAFRTRLQRTRSILKPLKLNEWRGLILHNEGKIRVNPDYTIISDEKMFNFLMDRLEKIEPDDPTGLEVCTEALDICRGVYMGYTREADWLNVYQKHYKNEFKRLCDETLRRMKVVGDSSATALLWRRAIVVIPEAEEVHKEIFNYMVEQQQNLEVLRYVSQLTRKGAHWMEEFEF